MKSEVAALITSKDLLQTPGQAETLMKKGKAAPKVVSTLGHLLLSGYLLIVTPRTSRDLDEEGGSGPLKLFQLLIVFS
jgi:hypothetical protein